MLELLNDKEVMDDYVLGKMIRYNHRYRLQDECVAAHSFFVSLFCLKIMAKLQLDHETERQVLILAALHDTAEIKTSDIPYDVKSRYPDMQEILDRIEKEYYEEHWQKYISDVYKPSEMVYNIIKLADAYSVYQYCLNENALGNVSDEMTEIKSEALVRITNHIAAINALLKEV
jgi:5'-deoxynucleotidase YfbR-like HD superfamily hydrolase